MLLSDYIYRTRRVLRDANARFWTDADLIIYINIARDRVVMDTLCTRALPVVSLVPNQETYSYQTILQAALTLSPAPSARNIATILNVTFVQTASLKPPLRRLSWSDFNRQFRSTPVNSFPLAWAQFDLATTIYIQPIISQTGYTIEVDCVFLPVNMGNPTDQENAIPDPLTELVPLFAASWATRYEQDKDRTETHRMDYEIEKTYMLASMPPFSVFNRFT